MFKINYICLLALFWCLPVSAQEKPTETIYGGEQIECLIYKGYNRQENSLRFKNECSEKVDAYVCIEYTDGKKELKRNSNSIPKRGNWKISADYSRKPETIHWSSAPFKPEIPAPCL